MTATPTERRRARRRRLGPAAGIWLALALAGCADPTRIVRQDVDWSTARIVRIRNLPNMIQPAHTKLVVGQPVRIQITNGFGPTANFISPFFNNVRYRVGTQSPGLVIRIDPAQRVELDVVPIKAGDYILSTIALGQGLNRPIIGDFIVTAP